MEIYFKQYQKRQYRGPRLYPTTSMITKDQVGKRVIMQMRDKKTGKVVWRNLGYSIATVYENGNVLLFCKVLPGLVYRERDVRVIEK